MPAARAQGYKWLHYADLRYITTRYLFWKGFRSDFALTGASAFELYLKAYIVERNASFSLSHDLSQLCKTCQGLDVFFERYTSDPDWEKGWPAYWQMYRYPEPAPGKMSGGFIYVGLQQLEQLDELADFVRDKIDYPLIMRSSSAYGDAIDHLINATARGPASFPDGDTEEIKETFLKNNKFFCI